MSESPLDALLRIAQEMRRRRLLTEVRVRDNKQVIALKEHLETVILPGGVGIIDIPIYIDEEIPIGIMRMYLSDGTTDDVRLT